ncbi:MAG: DUF1178 family protein [Pseudomonadota bacterium]
MIRFTLKCTHNHRFESWFQSNDAFDDLKARGLVSCPECGDVTVEKAIMAPRVRPARTAAPAPPEITAPAKPDPRAEALTKLRDHVEKNSEYVGMSFASEARAIHDGDAPDRAIYGEAKREDAVKLLEDGVPVAPLPFVPKAKTN